MKMIFLGPPGVGKGTYAIRISEKLGVPHISTGDLLRTEVKNETEIGKRAKEYMEAGKLVPVEIVNEMTRNRLNQDDCEKGFILDGFPRSLEQAKALEGIDIDVVVNLLQKDHILIAKISARRVCKNCGDIYNVVHIKEGEIDMPPLLPKVEGKCDKCGGELYQRSDDKEEVVRDRLEVYKKETQPLIDYYKEKNLLVDIVVTASPIIMVPRIMEKMENFVKN